MSKKNNCYGDQKGIYGDLMGYIWFYMDMKNGDQWKVMAIEIVDLPIKHGGSFHSYVKLPEGKWISMERLNLF